GIEAFLIELAALVATAVTAVSIGLLLSTVMKSSEAAMALTPIALIPQIVLGGLLVPATTIPQLSALMYVVPARWGFEAAVIPERMAIADDPAWLIKLGTDQSSATDYVIHGEFQCATAQLASDSLNGAWGFTSYETMWLPYAVLAAMSVVVLVFILVLLKRRDRI
ncbi:MAG TPA: hypothetical protein ENK23_00895, partial [Sorangium sp.]|nr:hypothetical protein [Sorangium sp.]